MDGNEEGMGKNLLENEDRNVFTCAATLSSQGMHSEVCSHKFTAALDINDAYFAQEGFSYTGLLLAGLESPQTFEPSTDQVGSSKFTAPSSGDGFTPLVNSGRYDHQHPKSSSDFQGNMQENSSTVCDNDNDNPWNINIFDDIELDMVYDEASARDENSVDHSVTVTSLRSQTAQGQSTSITSESGLSNQESNADKSNNITEKDVENFLSNEQLTDEEKKKTIEQAVDDFKPEIGMEFKTREDAQKNFNMYSYVVGFSVTCTSLYRTASKKRNNEIIRFTMKCNKYARNAETVNEQLVPQRQSTVISRTSCKVEMVASEKNGTWRITGLNLLHNHPLSPQSRFFRSHIYMSDGEKEMIRTMKNCNMPTRDMIAVLAFIRGGMTQLPYNKRKVSNYSASISREVDNNDMMEVWDWFYKKKTENPGFYYSIQYDKDKKVRCVFWADAMARIYYDTCGDCISFDTTFLTNRYNLPFAPFVGISPHGNTYLFACAFIVNEQAGTFKWLFEQFLNAMGGKHPISIITDADKAMENAIPLVFPDATHRGCLFHVKKKIDDKGETVFKANEGLYEDLQDIIDNSLTEHEFETLWQAMIIEHNVVNVKKIQDLWKTRKKWVPVYFKNKFFPFIQTTARSKGTNALFKRGVGAQFSFTSFLREYQRIMDTIHAKEAECDHNAKNKKVPCKMFLTEYYIERQAHDLYNLSIFRKFQRVLKDVTRLNIDEEQKGRKYWLFQANNYAFKERRPRRYLVQVNEEAMEYSCVCWKFEKDGLLCSHILKVMLHLQIDKIPDKYIIDRWRKKDKKLFQNYAFPLPTDEDSIVLRFNVLSRMLGHTASNASTNKRKYQFLLQEIPILEAKLASFDNEQQEESANEQDSSTMKTVVNLDPTDESASTLRLLDPDVVDPKGRPRLLTIKERIKKNLFYSCSHCGSNKHTLKNCNQKDLVFDLPKKKKARKKKEPGEGVAVNSNKEACVERDNENKQTGDTENQMQMIAPPIVNQQRNGGSAGAPKRRKPPTKKKKQTDASGQHLEQNARPSVNQQ